jgi:Tol biopolymer transport system component
MVLPTSALDLAPDASAKRFLYADDPAPVENEWRKHQVSDAAQDIWLYDSTSGEHHRLTEWRGEDRSPIWSPDGTRMLWLSERSGSFNVWRRPIDGGEPQQVTHHETWPVRFLTEARDGTLVYAWNGEIWRLPPGAGEPERVAVHIRQGSLIGGSSVVNVNDQASEMAVSPDGSEIALVARGDVFVVSASTEATRRITSTPAQERYVDFSPDGRRLAYASERDGTWDIIEVRLLRDEDKHFSGAAPFKEVALVGGNADAFQPVYSPSGDRIAYLKNRTAIVIYDIAAGRSIEVQPADAAYSYYDGDMHFAWSSDGRWLATQTGGFVQEIALVDAAGRAPRHNISLNGYTDDKPQVSADGNIVLWLSDRNGLRAATSEGVQKDVYAAFLTWDAQDRFRAKADEQPRPADEAPAGNVKAATNGSGSPFPDLDGLERRTQRLTPFSSQVQFFRLTPDNKRLILVVDQPNGTTVGYALQTSTLALTPLFTRPTAPDAAYATDAAVKALFVLAAGAITRYDLATGKDSAIAFNAEIERDARAEVAAMFDHDWRQTAQTFYRPDMQGVDWAAVGAHYRRFLPLIIHWEDLAEIMSEMVGELNASHQGALYRAASKTADATASLGLYYDDAYRGAGMRIAEILPGGPADRPGSVLKPGAVILSVDGQEIAPENRHSPASQPACGKADTARDPPGRRRRPGRRDGQAGRRVDRERTGLPALDRYAPRNRGKALGRAHRLHPPAPDETDLVSAGIWRAVRALQGCRGSIGRRSLQWRRQPARPARHDADRAARQQPYQPRRRRDRPQPGRSLDEAERARGQLQQLFRRLGLPDPLPGEGYRPPDRRTRARNRHCRRSTSTDRAQVRLRYTRARLPADRRALAREPGDRAGHPRLQRPFIRCPRARSLARARRRAPDAATPGAMTAVGRIGSGPGSSRKPARERRSRPLIYQDSLVPEGGQSMIRSFIAASALFLTGTAHAGIPLLNFSCPGGISVHADKGGPVYIDGKETKLKTFNENYYEATDRSSGVTVSISVNPDGSSSVSYTGKHGAHGVCQSAASGGSRTGAESGGGGDVPELAVRNSGEIEVRWGSGCTMLYNSDGNRLQTGGSCSPSQRSRSDDAVARHMREQGGSTAEGGGEPLNMRGYGTVTMGGPLMGRIRSKSGRSYALILTATKDGFTCTGSFDERPGSSDKAMSTPIHCTNGSSGSAILKGKLLTFSAGGKGGSVKFR